MSGRRRIWLLCALAFAVTAPRQAGAQDSALVVGTVVAAGTGAPLPYATFSITPGDVRRFTGPDGNFGARLPTSGSYTLSVKQLGYARFDTTIVMSGTRAPVRIRVALNVLPHRLASIRTTARRACSAGAIAGNSGDLAPALEAVRTNAEREILLRQTYPFSYRLSRITRLDGGEAWRRSADTAEFLSSAFDPYRPGGVVRERASASGGIREMRIPQLTDLANDTFLANHCFSYGGIQKVDGAVVYQIDFEPLADMTTPDVRGSIMLDTSNFQIRRARFQLTKGEDLTPPVAGLDVTTSYRDVFRGVSLFQEIKSVQAFTSTGAIENRQHQTETQRLLSVHFLRGSPEDADPLVLALAADSARAADSAKALAAVATARLRTSADSSRVAVASKILSSNVISADSLQHPLAPVVVAQSVPQEVPSDFLNRRAHGQGTYFTSEDIAKAKPRKISDMLRRVTGLRIQMKGEIYSNRGMASINEGTNACMHGLAIFVDNTQIGGGDMGDPTSLMGDQTRTNPEYVGPNSDLRSQLDAIDPRDVAAIEVYNGPATVPATLKNAASACGAVYIWTKAVR